MLDRHFLSLIQVSHQKIRWYIALQYDLRLIRRFILIKIDIRCGIFYYGNRMCMMMFAHKMLLRNETIN